MGTWSLDEGWRISDLMCEERAAVVEHGDRLLEDLKEFHDPVDEAWRLQRERFDLAHLLQQVVAAERRTARAAGHIIVLRGADGPVEVFADRRKLRRVFENLLSNAVKYSLGSGKTIRVRLGREDENVVVAFEDDGLGMNAEQLLRVLARSGRRAPSHLGIEGSGFGLDSCRRVLVAHGGSLRATSIPRLGSTFEALWPLE